MTVLLILSLAISAMLTGLIWFVQIVHYPLFAQIPPEHFVEYHRKHSTLTTWVVAPLMLVELLSAAWILAQPPPTAPFSLVLLQALLAAGVWALTFFIHVPQHQQLSHGFDAQKIRQLVHTNIWRVVFWTSRVIVLALLLLAST